METGGWRTGNVSQRLPWGCIQQNFCTNGKVKAAKRVSRYIYVYIIILSAWATRKSLKDWVSGYLLSHKWKCQNGFLCVFVLT